MFDFDAGKLMIIATVALVVIGPKDLPRVLRQLGQMVTRVKRMAGEFQNQFMDAMKEADIQELRDEVAKLKDTAKLDVDFNPVHDIKTELHQAINAPIASPPAVATGSTSETAAFTMPAPPEIEPVASIGAAGFGPASAIETLPPPEVATALPIVENSSTETQADGMAAVAENLAPPASRKSVVVRRRSRFDASAGKAPAWQRSRNILPARRETPEA